MSDPNTTSMDLLGYRVSQLENKFETFTTLIGGKLDLIISTMATLNTERAVDTKTIQQLYDDMADLQEALEGLELKLENDVKELTSQVTQVKLTLAEKLGWGAAGGAVISIVLGLAEWLLTK